jgi:hypothetical protein
MIAGRGLNGGKRNVPRRKGVAPIALFCESGPCSRHHPRVGRDGENSQMSRNLRILVACAILAGLAACAAPPPAPVVTAPPPKPLDAKTQLENHM